MNKSIFGDVKRTEQNRVEVSGFLALIGSPVQFFINFLTVLNRQQRITFLSLLAASSFFIVYPIMATAKPWPNEKGWAFHAIDLLVIPVAISFFYLNKRQALRLQTIVFWSIFIYYVSRYGTYLATGYW